MNNSYKEKYKDFSIKGLTKRFKQACLSGNLNLIQYFLTSEYLKEKVCIHTNDDFAFRMACKKGYFEIVEYLLKSPDLKEHANKNVYNNIGFRQAIENGHYDIANYLLYFKLEDNLPKGIETKKLKI